MACVTYNSNSQIKFKTTIIESSSLCDYSEAYIPVKGTTSVANTAAEDAHANNENIKVVYRNFALFTGCMSEINNRRVDSAKGIDVVMLMCDMIKYIVGINLL